MQSTVDDVDQGAETNAEGQESESTEVIEHFKNRIYPKIEVVAEEQQLGNVHDEYGVVDGDMRRRALMVDCELAENRCEADEGVQDVVHERRDDMVEFFREYQSAVNGVDRPEETHHADAERKRETVVHGITNGGQSLAVGQQH